MQCNCEISQESMCVYCTFTFIWSFYA